MLKLELGFCYLESWLIDHHYECIVRYNTTLNINLSCEFELVAMFPSQSQVILFEKYEKLMKGKRNITCVDWMEKSQRKEMGGWLCYSFSTTKAENPLNLYKQF